MKIKFHSDYERICGIHTYAWDVIKREPQFFRASLDFALKNGGPITHAFLENLPKGWGSERLVIDSRVHMLMPGFYPCIPGWHLDDIPRTRKDGQPDHAKPRYYARHVAMICGDASRTAFLRGDLELEDVPEYGGVVYAKWHEEIEALLKRPETKLRVDEISDHELVEFGWGSFHKGMAAKKRGWRLFIRATKHTEIENANEIRTQTQVYFPSEGAGW